MADGYTGLRVAVDATELVRTESQREGLARYEHLIDRAIVGEPFFALCGYDGARLGIAAAAEFACLHPRISPQAASFQWWADSDADMGLCGEIDVASVELFDLALRRTLPWLPRGRVSVNAHDLGYIDHRGLLTLERQAQRHDQRVVLHTDSPVVHRLADLMDLHAVRPRGTP